MEAAERRQLRAAEKAAALGNLANTRLNYAAAMAAAREAAELVPESAPLVRTEYLNASGAAAWYGGRYAAATPLLEEALAIRERELDAEHLYTANSLSNLALLYKELGRLSEAEPLFTRALAIREKVLGVEHLYTANSLSNLALLYEAQGRLSEAEPLYTRPWRLVKRCWGSSILIPRPASTIWLCCTMSRAG